MHVAAVVLAALVLFGYGMYPVPAGAAGEVGLVKVVKGVASAQTDGEDPRLLAQQSPIYRSDTLITGKKSFLIVNLDDGSAITLRSDSRLKVADYSREAGDEKALIELGKGGLRMLTGAIGRLRPENVSVRTRVASIGIRGTDFIVRICGPGECEQAGAASTVLPARRVAGSVLDHEGQVAAAAGRRWRALGGREPVLAGDTIVTAPGSRAIIGFEDGTRVVLDQSTVFNIVNYRYRGVDVEENGFVMRLREGSMRVLAGDIARTDPDRFTLDLENATVLVDRPGIEFEVAQRSPSTVRPTGGEPVRILSGGNRYDAVAGRTYRFESAGQAPGSYPSTTSLLDGGATDTVAAVLAQAEGGEDRAGAGGADRGESPDASGPGPSASEREDVYVSVRDGSVGVQNEATGEDLTLIQGQAAGVNRSGSAIIPEPPIISQDPVLNIDLDRIDVNDVNMGDAVGDENTCQA